MSFEAFLALPKTGVQAIEAIPFYQRESIKKDRASAGEQDAKNVVREDQVPDRRISEPVRQSKRKMMDAPNRESATFLPDFISLLPDSTTDGARDNQKEKQKGRDTSVKSRDRGSSGTVLGWAKIPWQRREYSNNTAIGLHQEIEDFVEYISPTDAEKHMRTEVVDRIKAVVQKLWPAAEVELFGSVASDIYLPTSDIDMVIQGKWPVLPLRTLAEALKEAQIPSKMQIIAKARVPIIKLKDAHTSLDIDISFNMTNGPEEARRIRDYMKEHPALRPLTLVVKQLLSQRCLNEVYSGGVGSYAILLMIMSFLQAHPRQNEIQNLGVLLIEFFELYGTQLYYENVVVSTINGGRYFPKRGHWYDERRPFLLSIQNPRSPDEDVSKNSFAVESIRRAFEHAYHVLASAFFDAKAGRVPPSSLEGIHASLLSRIVRLPQEVVYYRMWVQKKWGSTSLANSSNTEVNAAAKDSNSTRATVTKKAKKWKSERRKREGHVHPRKNGKKNPTMLQNRRNVGKTKSKTGKLTRKQYQRYQKGGS